MPLRAAITALLLTAVSLQAVLGGLGVPSVLLCFGHHAAHAACQLPAAANETAHKHTSCSCAHAHDDHHHEPRPARLLDAIPVPHAPDDHDHPHERCTDIELAVADLTSLPRHDAADAWDLVPPVAVTAWLPAQTLAPSATVTIAPVRPRHAPTPPSVGTVRAVRFQV